MAPCPTANNPAAAANISTEYGYDWAHLPGRQQRLGAAALDVENERCGRKCSCSTEAAVTRSAQVFCLQPGVPGAVFRQRRRPARRRPGQHLSWPAHHCARYARLRHEHDTSQSLLMRCRATLAANLLRWKGRAFFARY